MDCQAVKSVLEARPKHEPVISRTIGALGFSDVPIYRRTFAIKLISLTAVVEGKARDNLFTSSGRHLELLHLSVSGCYYVHHHVCFLEGTADVGKRHLPASSAQCRMIRSHPAVAIT